MFRPATNEGTQMTEHYIPDEHYSRLIDLLLANVVGSIFSDERDKLMFALGEKAGIWPEYSRPAGE